MRRVQFAHPFGSTREVVRWNAAKLRTTRPAEIRSGPARKFVRAPTAIAFSPRLFPNRHGGNTTRRESWFRRKRSHLARPAQFLKLFGHGYFALERVRTPHLQETSTEVYGRPPRFAGGLHGLLMRHKFGHRLAIAHDGHRFARNQVRIQLMRIGVDVLQCESFQDALTMPEYRPRRNLRLQIVPRPSPQDRFT